MNGVDLVKKVNNKEVYGLTTPLILNSSGLKMGKTSEGAVWLDKNLLSSYDYWQFWRNTDDKDVIRYLKLFTELDLEKIKDYEGLSGSDINQAKIVLADEATKLLHGKEDALKAKKTSINTFEKSGGDELPTTRINKKYIKKRFTIKRIYNFY